MIDRKPRPLWPLLTAAMIGLPLLYVASFGPACWICGRLGIEELPMDYAPVGSAMQLGPEAVNKALYWYASVGLEGSYLLVPTFTDEDTLVTE